MNKKKLLHSIIIVQLVFVVFLAVVQDVDSFVIQSSIVSKSLAQKILTRTSGAQLTRKQRKQQVTTSSSNRPETKPMKNKTKTAIATTTTTTTISSTTTTKKRKRNILSRVVHLYTDYASRLWKETNHESRQKIKKDKIASTIQEVQKVILTCSTSSNRNDMGLIYNDVVPEKARIDLQNACDAVLRAIQLNQEREEDANKCNNHDHEVGVIQSSTIPVLHNGLDEPNFQLAMIGTGVICDNQELSHYSSPLLHSNGSSNDSTMSFARVGANGATEQHDKVVATSSGTNNPQLEGNSAVLETNTSSRDIKKNAKGTRSIAFGALMGAIVTCWVFSGNYIFTGLFTLMTVLGQLEYYRMIMQTGIYPARRISVLGACSMFLTALIRPDLHQICLPMFGLWTMVGFLYFKKRVTTISEIATTFTGMFYLGYVPSFWVRIRLIGMNREPTRLAPIVGPILNFIGTTAKQQAEASPIIPNWLPQAVHLPITTGAVFIFWTWLCIAFSDVGAYFVGKTFGKTKLSVISPAAGATSPNKTVEGVVGGCTVSALLAVLGAWIQRWPYPIVTGTVHGILLGLLGLLGDLTASMIKRDAGVKDFGDLLPEHGGIMDRVDSFIWAAPYSWVVCAYIIPGLKAMFAGS